MIEFIKLKKKKKNNFLLIFKKRLTTQTMGGYLEYVMLNGSLNAKEKEFYRKTWLRKFIDYT